MDATNTGLTALAAQALDTTHSSLIALRDGAPEHCSPADISSPRDRYYLSRLVSDHAREIASAKLRANIVEDESKRVHAENARLRSELADAKVEIERLKLERGAA